MPSIPKWAACGNCTWFCMDESTSREGEYWGECHIAPPVVIPDGNGGSDSVRPSTHAHDSCKQWERREDE
jgi:hypothetical protein